MSRTRASVVSRPAPARRARAFAALLAALVFAAVAAAHPRMHDTIEELTALIAGSPNDQRLYLERGNAYSNDGDAKSALADFRKAEALGDPDLVAYDLGVLFYRSRDYVAAREALTRSLARFPSDPRALDYRARAARELGDAAAALADFEALFAVARDVNPGQYVAAAELAASLEDRGISSALALLDFGIAKLGAIPQLQRRAIAYERERGGLAAALRRHDTLAAPLARNPEWRTERAELLLALKRADEARTELNEAARALDAARPTPARAELKLRIEALRAQLDPAR